MAPTGFTKIMKNRKNQLACGIKFNFKNLGEKLKSISFFVLLLGVFGFLIGFQLILDLKFKL
jgi:hypothetical protein